MRPFSELAKAFAGKARGAVPLALIPAVLAVTFGILAAFRAHAGIEDEQRLQWPAEEVAPPPLLLRPLSESAAIALNRQIPFSRDPGTPATPLAVAAEGDTRARALECLTSAIYYEAASESAEGQAAVAQVILNRVRHPAFPASICSVVYQGSTRPTGCQFSYTCDGSLRRKPSRAAWDQAQRIAGAALSGAVYAPVGLATHYHTEQVMPYWAPTLAKSVQVGAHIFYRWAGRAGRPIGFTQRYSGRESDPLAFRSIALISHDIWPADRAVPVKPRLSLAIAPDAELDGIVRVLATPAQPDQSAYEMAIRTHFSSESARPLFRLLSGTNAEISETAPSLPSELIAVEPPEDVAAPVKPVSLKLQMREFGREMRLASFLRAHLRLYKATTKQVQLLAEASAMDWEVYAGAPVQGRSAVLSLSQGLSHSRCPAFVPSASNDRVIPWPIDRGAWGSADVFLASGFAEDGLRAVDGVPKSQARQLAAAVEPIESQIVAAVFARIAALSRGEAASRAIVQREVAKGHELVPHLVQRLRLFERNRDRYPSLNHYLPALIAGLPQTKPEKMTKDPAACVHTPSVAT